MNISKIMKKINIIKVSNYMMNIGIVLAIYTGYKIYDSRKGLPEGACPISDNNFIIYTTIVILLISLILSFIGERMEKNKTLN